MCALILVRETLEVLVSIVSYDYKRLSSRCRLDLSDFERAGLVSLLVGDLCLSLIDHDGQLLDLHVFIACAILIGSEVGRLNCDADSSVCLGLLWFVLILVARREGECESHEAQ